MPTKAEKEGWVPAVIDEATVTSIAPSLPVELVNMVQIAKDLSAEITKPRPATWLGKWFGAKSIALDNRRLGELASYIDRVRTVNESVVSLQAELYLAPKVLEYIIDGNLSKARQQVEIQLQEHKLKLKEIEDQRARIDDEAVARRLQMDKVRAETEAMRASTHLTKMQGLLLDKIVSDLNLENITAAQAFVLVKALDPNANASADFASKEYMMEQELEKMKAENRKYQAQARKEEAQARREEVQADLDEHVKDETIKGK